MAIGQAIQDNKGLLILGLAWNGFGHMGCGTMAAALEKNKTLLEIDLSANRVDNVALAMLLISSLNCCAGCLPQFWRAPGSWRRGSGVRLAHGVYR